MTGNTEKRNCPADLLSESALRQICRSEGRIPPEQVRGRLQADAALASLTVPGDSVHCDTLEEWLEGETAFLGYRMDLLYRRCEIRLMTLEAQMAMCVLLGQRAEIGMDLDAAWRKLMDAEYVRHGGRTLQDAAVSDLQSVIQGADMCWQELAGRLVPTADEGNWACVFNLYPMHRTMFTCIRSSGPVAVYAGSRRLPSQYIDGDNATAIELEMDGLSAESLRIEPDGPAYECVPLCGAYSFENEVMRVTVQPDGRVTGLESLRNGVQLHAGNMLRLRWKDASGHEQCLKGEEIPMAGRVVKGELFDNIYLKGAARGVGVEMVLYLPHHDSRRIEIMLDLVLSEPVRKSLLSPESAVWLEWQVAVKNPEIRCDRPFGWTECAEGMPLHSSNGIGIGSRDNGVIFDHQGVTRGWFHKDTLYTLLGRGGSRTAEDGPAGVLDARMPESRDSMKWRFFYAVDLSDGETPEEVFRRVCSYQFPMLPVRCRNPLTVSSLLETGKGLIPSALLLRNGKAVLRGYSGSDSPVYFRAGGALGFDGKEVLEPFGVFEKELGQ